MSHLEIHQSIDLRMVQGAEVFAQGKTTGNGEFIAWLAHKDGAAPGPIDLLMFADIMPPPIFTLYGAYGWVPTVELTVQVRRKPAAGPLLARHTTRQVTRGVAETDTEIWDVMATWLPWRARPTRFGCRKPTEEALRQAPSLGRHMPPGPAHIRKALHPPFIDHQ